MPCYINIEDRYNCRSLKARQQFNVFAATATALGASAAVAGAIGAGTTAAIGAGATLAASSMQSKAAGKAAAAQGKASKQAMRAEQAALEDRKKAVKRYRAEQQALTGEMAGIQAPEYNLPAMIADAEEASRSERAQAFGSEAEYEAIRKQVLANISQGLAGQLTDAELGAVRREQAFLQGAGFNPATAGRGAVQQVGPYSYLRAIGGEAGRKIGESFNLLGQWGDIAKSYIKGAEPFGALRYQYGMGAANVGLSKINTRRQMLSDLYNAQLGLATGQQEMGQRQYERQLELEKTRLAQGQAGAEGFTGAAGGLTSGLTSALDAYTKYKTAQEGSTTATKEGFYTSQLGGASAYDTAPSNLKFYTGKGWSLG